MTWELEQVDDEYRDYNLPIPDVNKHGMRMRLTINTETRTAYFTLTLDNEECDIFLDGETLDVPLPWALAVAHGVDGFTLPPEEATA
jgi:hypothetical protein